MKENKSKCETRLATICVFGTTVCVCVCTSVFMEYLLVHQQLTMKQTITNLICLYIVNMYLYKFVYIRVNCLPYRMQAMLMACTQYGINYSSRSLHK